MKKFFYRVEKEDSLVKICNRFGVALSVVIKQNALEREVERGDLLYIEKCDGLVYTAQPLDTPNSIAKKFGVSESELLTKNGIEYVFYGLNIYI